MYKCPKCSSQNVKQHLSSTGIMWCDNCKFTIENKEDLLNNPFINNTPANVTNLSNYYNKMNVPLKKIND